MQLPDRRKLFQQRHHRRVEIEAQLRRAQIEEQSSSENSSSEDEDSFEDESEEEVGEDESEDEMVNEDESEEEVVNEGESEEEVANEDESEEEIIIEDGSEEEADESEKEEEEIIDEEEYNTSFNEKSLENSSRSHNSSNNLSINTIKVKVDDSKISVVHDESKETLQDNTVIVNNNVLMNKNNSDHDDEDDDDKSQILYNSNFNMNDLQNQVVEWMITRESQKPYGGIIATDMGTIDCKITILMHLLSKSNLPNSDNTQSEGETDLDETISSKGCTLILCPRSSIDHWFDLLKKQGSLNVWLHYGRCRDISLHDLTQKDVVITTVTLVLTSFRNKLNDPLYQIKWHRIILDDIKLYNYKQQTSKALCQLSGICHWVFSGPTIIDNDDDEAIYSLIKFIHYKPLNIFENWKNWIKANKTVSIYEKLGHLYYKMKIV
ncbi:PREDICTED: uncharacterized ATP-dependent helicase C582.10c-like isoform X2 [Diuraphis noxia]|uniref:uncharacterized ATP-dependent helicase C582.10c-like isoform X2 n=1 Tax=Diuraphis noxia TaxID=143948 RepID=UPI0007637D32|nr:PREDICTED: uncharacterized ATP-dependent helicase C582.10c-like isoform X2 [Diuraphis noxia]